MARARNPNQDKAFEIYKQHNGNISNREIAKMLNEDEKVIAVWKGRGKWEQKTNVVQQSNQSCTTLKNDVQKNIKQIVNEVVAEEVNQVLENEELTDRQRLFCLYYADSFNATKSYQRAYKCSYETAMVEGSNHLRNPKIKEVIYQLKQGKLNRAMLEPSDVFQWYMNIATANMKDFVTFGNNKFTVKDKSGSERTKTVSYVNIKNDDEVDGWLISEISMGKDGVKVKLPDKTKAMEWIANHMDMATAEQKARIDKIRSEIEQSKNSSTEVVDDWIGAVTGEDVTEDE